MWNEAICLSLATRFSLGQPAWPSEAVWQVQSLFFVQTKIGLLATGEKKNIYIYYTCILLSHPITHISLSLCMTQHDYFYLFTVVQINIVSPSLYQSNKAQAWLQFHPRDKQSRGMSLLVPVLPAWRVTQTVSHNSKSCEIDCDILRLPKKDNSLRFVFIALC